TATAIVSGIVALIRSAHPDWTAAQVIDRLIHTAYRPPGKGYSTKHGFGIPDAAEAVTSSAPAVCENPLGSVATDSAGIWPTIVAHPTALTYTPKCSGSSSSSSASTPPSTSAESQPVSSPSTSEVSSSGDSGGGVPA